MRLTRMAVDVQSNHVCSALLVSPSPNPRQHAYLGIPASLF
jgi:hypothetical protein